MVGLLVGIAALAGMLLWIAFVAQSVLTLTEPSAAKLLAWAVAVPIVVAVEAGMLWMLERHGPGG